MPMLPSTVDPADMAERLQPLLHRAGVEAEIALERAQSAFQAGFEGTREVALRHGVDPGQAASRARQWLRWGSTRRQPTTLQLVLLSVALSLLATVGAVVLVSLIRRWQASCSDRPATRSARATVREPLRASAVAQTDSVDAALGAADEDVESVTAA